MDEASDVRAKSADELNDQLKEWETPTLIIEDVQRVTRGGPYVDVKPEGAVYGS